MEKIVHPPKNTVTVTRICEACGKEIPQTLFDAMGFRRFCAELCDGCIQSAMRWAAFEMNKRKKMNRK